MDNKEFYEEILKRIENADNEMKTLLEEGNKLYTEIKQKEEKLKQMKTDRHKLEEHINNLCDLGEFTRKDLGLGGKNEKEMWALEKVGYYFDFEY